MGRFGLAEPSRHHCRDRPITVYLSRLDIIGFKSFANKINLSFDEGMTAIVGPNGCGKTNVVDAIRWALGEQKPTMLRSDKMEDVIFNGTKSRKQLGMAEVSITIQNSKGILPSEYTEVTITRRVYRSGESEYYLNKTLCRLKDIRDLFMDTGMGSDAYSVIELKMVEQILSDSSDERRRLFEESAGVTKYKHRRKEAYRRLDSVRTDLLRVNDILRGVEKQVGTLERQANKAEQYNELSVELRTKEIELLEREYASIASRIGPLRQQLTVAVDQKVRIDVEVRQEEALLDVLRSELNELEEQLHAAQESLSSKQDRIHSFRQNQATATERKRSLENNIERYTNEIRELEKRIEEQRLLRTKHEADLEGLSVGIAAAEKEYGERAAELESFEAQLNQKRLDVKSAQDAVIDLLQKLGVLRNRESQARARVENIRGRVGYTSEESETYRGEIDENVRRIAEITGRHRDLRKRAAEAEVRVHQSEDYRTSLQKSIDDLKHKESDLRAAVERTGARMDFLRGLVESMDGVSDGARFLFTDPVWKSRVRTTVGETVTTDQEYRIAIENALGDTVGYVIVDSGEAAYAAMAHLKKEQKGRATFICLDRIPPVVNHPHPVEGSGIVGWARDLVTVSGVYDSLVRYILEGTLVVETVEAAKATTGRYTDLRCVTLDGDVVTSKEVVRGGSPRQNEGGQISKRAQLEELRTESERLGHERSQVLNEISTLAGELRGLAIRDLQEEARTLEQEKVQLEVTIAQLEFEKKRAEESIQRNESESQKLESEMQTLRRDLEQLTPEVEELEVNKTRAEKEVGSTSSELETMEVLWQQFSARANDANMKLLGLKGEERSMKQQIEHMAETVATMESTVEERFTQIENAKKESGELGARIAETEEALESAQLEFTFEADRKKVVDKDYSAKRTQIHTIELKLKDERLKQQGSLKAAHDLELKIHDLDTMARALAERAQDEFSLTLGERKPDESEGFDISAARESIRVMKEKLRALGAVNFAAFDEYKSEKERLDFMVAQRNDLEESEKTLIQTIDEINTTAQNQFMETFEKIRENFIMTFKGLFDEGDEADLRLEDGMDPLEARIAIIAKPRGKRPTSIDLLSGGEKTLTAIALLFAIYLVKPSPFCILDEVDAPLDDTNIDRFTRIIRRFSDNTQFVIVTHNKRTMEAANAMYGVTMEEEGVSKLVSVRFNEAAQN